MKEKVYKWDATSNAQCILKHSRIFISSRRNKHKTLEITQHRRITCRVLSTYIHACAAWKPPRKTKMQACKICASTVFSFVYECGLPICWIWLEYSTIITHEKLTEFTSANFFILINFNSKQETIYSSFRIWLPYFLFVLFSCKSLSYSYNFQSQQKVTNANSAFILYRKYNWNEASIGMTMLCNGEFSPSMEIQLVVYSR